MSGTILIVEDDEKIAAILADYLRAAGFTVEREGDGAAGLEAVKARSPALVLLDIMLPKMDGLEVCKAVRRFSTVPILMLTARVDEIDRLLGLELGADDYVCKPFSPREVVARVKALLRRSQPSNSAGTLVTGGFVVDDVARRIRLGARELPLTPLEYELLRTFLREPERVFSRDRLLDAIHDDLRDVSDRAIDSHVKNVRRKIDAARPGLDCIRSVYGVGYRYEPGEPS